MLLITSTGIFLPLEVALNSIWGFKKNRSYLMNLIVSLGLALACGCLAMLSIALTAQNLKMLGLVIGDQNIVFRGLGFIVMKASAILATIGIYFLIYWLLPHGKVPVRAVLPAAIITGLVSEAAKYIYILALPMAQLSGSVRTIRGVGHADLLVVLERHAIAGRSVFVGRGTCRPRAGTTRNCCRKPLTLWAVAQSTAVAAMAARDACSRSRRVKRIAEDISCEGFSIV